MAPCDERRAPDDPAGARRRPPAPRRRTRGAGLAIALGGAAACAPAADDGAPPGGAPGAAGAADVAPSEFARRGLDVVLTIGCGECHAGDANSGGLAFSGRSAPEMRAALVGGASSRAPGLRLVVPGDPDASFLVRKLRGDFAGLACAGGDCGARMPIGNYPFAEGDRLDVEEWIAAGADLPARAPPAASAARAFARGARRGPTARATENIK
jgi:hypothetical protein